MNSNFENQDFENSDKEKASTMVEQDAVPPKVEVLTGLRPTGDLTVANFVGAVAPIVELQENGKHPMIFVADLHAMTDKEPELAMKFTYDIVADYIALGLDPKKSDIFIQSSIAPQIAELTLYLMRHITVAELMRVPTLKEKLRKGQREESANALLATYPVMMAADILLQRARDIPVGDDQVPHIEVTKLLARRFNSKYGPTFHVPKVQQVETLRILALNGKGKMSKTNPDNAIFLTDTPDLVTKKIKRAQTAFEGEMTPALTSHITLAKCLADTQVDRQSIDEIIAKHMKGEAVMGDFKKKFTEIILKFLGSFQQRRALVVSDPTYIQSILKIGADKARENASETLNSVRNAMIQSPQKEND